MKEVSAWLILVVAVAVAGRLWVRLPLPLARTAAWGILVSSVALTATVPWHPIARMLALCCVLLAAMKALVYVEWAARDRRLNWAPFLAFAFLCFGMNPGAFARRPGSLEWRSHLTAGLGCLVAGTLLALLARNAGWSVLVLAPLGLLFPPAFREQILLPCLRALPDFAASIPL